MIALRGAQARAVQPDDVHVPLGGRPVAVPLPEIRSAMAATTKSTRRTSGGRSAESDARRSTSRRGGEGEAAGGGRRREAASGERGGARKLATGARKSAATARKGAGRKTSAKKAAPSGGRKTSAKASSSARGRKATGTRAAEDKRTGGSRTARGARKAASRKSTPSRGARAGKESGGRKETGGRERSGKMDALSLLKQDHEHVDDLLRKFERMKEGDDRKQALLQEILEEVRAHAQVEEELFYPALRTLFEEDGKEKEIKLIAEADVEHETVKWLMAELEGGSLQAERVDARVKVLGEYIRHHVEEEEGQIFRAAKRSDLDLDELGRQMDARKRELKGEPVESGEEGMSGTGMQGGMDTGATRAVSPGTH
jgi:hypothetical protein